jgi:hypothetical protein
MAVKRERRMPTLGEDAQRQSERRMERKRRRGTGAATTFHGGGDIDRQWRRAACCEQGRIRCVPGRREKRASQDVQPLDRAPI